MTDSLVTASSGDGRTFSFDEFVLAGWSVLVRGRAELLEWDQLPDQDHRPEPWAAGSRNVYVVITAEKVTGRRVLPT